MAPIRKGDGTPLEIPGVSEVRSGDGRVFFDGVAIPDSVVSRPEDDDTTDQTEECGLVITAKSDWSSIGARISNNTSGVTRAYLRDHTAESLIDDVDISNLSSGDAFTFDDVNLESENDYSITVGAEGSSYDLGFRRGETDYPYTSDDVDIVGAVGTDEDPVVQGVNDIGNVGFD